MHRSTPEHKSKKQPMGPRKACSKNLSPKEATLAKKTSKPIKRPQTIKQPSILGKRPRGRPEKNLIKKILKLGQVTHQLEKRQKREQNKLMYGHLERIYFEGLTNVEKQAIHCSAYQVGFKPVPHDRAKYIVRSDVAAPSQLTCDRLRSEPVILKAHQQEMSLKVFCSRYLLDTTRRNPKDGHDVDEDIDVASLRYTYMMVGQYPAFGEWHLLMKRYRLQGVGGESGLRDIMPAQTKITEWDEAKYIHQGTCKVIYLSLHFMAAWVKHLKTTLPPKTGERWSTDKDGNRQLQWYYKEGDLRTQGQVQANAFRWQLDSLFDQAWLPRYAHMLLYVCAAEKDIPHDLDYNATVDLSNGRPIFRSLWVSEHLTKQLVGVRPLFMKQEVRPRLAPWDPERVESMRPEYIFHLPKKYQKEEAIDGVGLDEESPVQLGLGWTIAMEEMEDSES